MKFLSDYIEEKQQALHDELGLFWAFNDEQFMEGIDKIKKNKILLEGEKVVRLPGGGFIPHKNFDEYLERVSVIHQEGMAQDIADNTLEGIVRRELDNHEASYTGDIESTWDALQGYPGLTKEHVWKIYCNKNYKIPVEND